jgi:hypothetical protein
MDPDERTMIELARDNRGAETGNAQRRAAEQLKLIAKAQERTGVVVVRTLRRPT